MIVDDMIKDRVDDHSELASQQRKEWFSSTAYTRLMSKNLDKGQISAIIAIGTRWSYNDFMSYLETDLSHENWTNIKLPAICEDIDIQNNGVDIIGRKAGEVLWEEKFNIERLEKTKKTLTPLDWSALYQQRPLPTSGGMVNLSDFQRFDLNRIYQQREILQGGGEVPENMQFINHITISIDSASKTNAVHDMTAITIWGSDKLNTKHYLLSCINTKVDFPDLVKLVANTHAQFIGWKMGTPLVLCEDRSSGIALIQHLKKTTKIPIVAVSPCKSKDLRMEDALVHINSGRIFLPNNAPWLYDVELQISQFPLGRYRDICDSISQFINSKFSRKIRKRTNYKGYIR
jgi:predicted phage terminase large subunit-like protein